MPWFQTGLKLTVYLQDDLESSQRDLRQMEMDCSAAQDGHEETHSQLLDVQEQLAQAGGKQSSCMLASCACYS